MFIDNKYSRWYYSIILARQGDPYLSGCSEKHHILPKSLGGSNDSCNIVVLSLREHFICHLLLPKFIVGPERSKMVRARWLMCTKAGRKVHDYRVNSRTFAQARKEYVTLQADAMRARRHTQSTKDKIALRVTGEKNGRFGKRKEVTVRSLDAATRSRQSSPEHRTKLSKAKQGKPRSDETKQKIRDGWARRKAAQASLVG